MIAISKIRDQEINKMAINRNSEVDMTCSAGFFACYCVPSEKQESHLLQHCTPLESIHHSRPIRYIVMWEQHVRR